MKIKAKGEYSELVRRYFQSSFPKQAVTKGRDLLEILTNHLVGSKELRYGAMPSPENLVVIRRTITKSIDFGLPIPVLVPWGGRKMDKSLGLDIAEISALRQLLHVDENIRKFHAPGLLIQIRIEDLNALWLYKDREGIEEYSQGMKNLIKMVKGSTKMIGVRESEMMDEDAYMAAATMYTGLLGKVIADQIDFPMIKVMDIPEYQTLLDKGWRGEIPKEQRDYYLDRYKRMDPSGSEQEHITKLADYFAGSKARYDLNGRGEPKTEVGSFIQINFAHPVPAAPTGLFSNTLYYRTIPACQARTHIAPWRAKGYLQMIGDNITPKIAYPGAPLDLYTSFTELEGETAMDPTIKLETDYTYEDNVIEAFLAYPPTVM